MCMNYAVSSTSSAEGIGVATRGGPILSNFIFKYLTLYLTKQLHEKNFFHNLMVSTEQCPPNKSGLLSHLNIFCCNDFLICDRTTLICTIVCPSVCMRRGRTTLHKRSFIMVNDYHC